MHEAPVSRQGATSLWMVRQLVEESFSSSRRRHRVMRGPACLRTYATSGGKNELPVLDNGAEDDAPSRSKTSALRKAVFRDENPKEESSTEKNMRNELGHDGSRHAENLPVSFGKRSDRSKVYGVQQMGDWPAAFLEQTADRTDDLERFQQFGPLSAFSWPIAVAKTESSAQDAFQASTLTKQWRRGGINRAESKPRINPGMARCLGKY